LIIKYQVFDTRINQTEKQDIFDKKYLSCYFTLALRKNCFTHQKEKTMKVIGTIILGLVILIVLSFLISMFGEGIFILLIIALFVGGIFKLLNR
jgi:hypothetical protein